MDFLAVLNEIDNFIWGPPLLVLLVGTGILLTIRLHLLQIFKLPKALSLIFRAQNAGSGDIDSFKALCTALSATVGTGNIVGVATAIHAGGPGALFWMWMAAFFGMATKYAEGLLAVKYRETDEKGESSLRDFLTELPETLCVDITIDGEYGRFWFPEFFEEGVENTPARILENHVHGSGIRYRNSFVHKKINTLEYDRLFPYAVAWEQERIVLNLALDRILYPVSMTDEAKEKYLIYIKEHIQQAIRLLGEQKAYDSMQRILRKLAPDRAETEKMLETAQSANDSRCVSILMNELQKHGRKQRKAFEL